MEQVNSANDEIRRRRQERILLRSKERLDVICGLRDKVSPIEEKEREEFEAKQKEKPVDGVIGQHDSGSTSLEVAVYPTSRCILVITANLLVFMLNALMWSRNFSMSSLLISLLVSEILSLTSFSLIVRRSPFIGSGNSGAQANTAFRMLITVLLVAFRTPQNQITFALNMVINLSCVLFDFVLALLTAYAVMFLVNL